MSFQKSEFLEILKSKKFKTEESLEKYFIGEIPALLRISKDRAKNQHTTTSFDYTLSNISDVVIFSKAKKSQAIIAFELKLDESVEKYSSYDDAKRQLHKYCQDLNCPYGVLLSDTKCYIFHYEYDGSEIKTTEINSLPSTEEIENEALGIEEKIKKMEDTLSDIKREKIEVGMAVSASADSIKREVRGDIQEHKRIIAQRSRTSKIVISILVAILFIGAGIFFYYKRTVDLNCENIKGNITIKNGVENKIYHTKDSPSYNSTQIDTSKGEKIFCNEKEAIEAGFRRWVEYKGN